MIRLGIIGPGLIWKLTHKKIIRSMDGDFCISAFSARSQETLDACASEFPEAQLYREYHELIASREVDAVVVLTPIELNGPIASAVLEAGKIAIVEKPLAASTEELSRIADAVTRTKGQLFVLEQAVYRPVLARIRELIEEDAIGRVVAYEKTTHNLLADGAADTTGGFGSTEWRKNTIFPIGNMFDGGIHDLAFLQELFSAPDRVIARGSSIREGYGEYDLVNVIASYDRGLLGTISHASALPQGQNRLTIRGERGILTLEDDILQSQNLEGERRTIEYGRESDSVLMWHEIASCIAEHVEPRYTLDHATRDLNTLFAIDKSLASAAEERVL